MYCEKVTWKALEQRNRNTLVRTNSISKVLIWFLLGLDHVRAWGSHAMAEATNQSRWLYFGAVQGAMWPLRKRCHQHLSRDLSRRGAISGSALVRCFIHKIEDKQNLCWGGVGCGAFMFIHFKDFTWLSWNAAPMTNNYQRKPKYLHLFVSSHLFACFSTWLI